MATLTWSEIQAQQSQDKRTRLIAETYPKFAEVFETAGLDVSKSDAAWNEYCKLGNMAPAIQDNPVAMFKLQQREIELALEIIEEMKTLASQWVEYAGSEKAKLDKKKTTHDVKFLKCMVEAQQHAQQAYQLTKQMLDLHNARANLAKKLPFDLGDSNLKARAVFRRGDVAYKVDTSEAEYVAAYLSRFQELAKGATWPQNDSLDWWPK